MKLQYPSFSLQSFAKSLLIFFVASTLFSSCGKKEEPRPVDLAPTEAAPTAPAPDPELSGGGGGAGARAPATDPLAGVGKNREGLTESLRHQERLAKRERPAQERASREVQERQSRERIEARPVPEYAASPALPATAEVSDPFGAVTEIVKRMEKANISFNTPKTMNRDDTVMIQLLLSLSQTMDELKGKISAEGENKLQGFQFQESWRLA